MVAIPVAQDYPSDCRGLYPLEPQLPLRALAAVEEDAFVLVLEEDSGVVPVFRRDHSSCSKEYELHASRINSLCLKILSFCIFNLYNFHIDRESACHGYFWSKHNAVVLIIFSDFCTRSS